MRMRLPPLLAIVYFLAMAIAVTYPGYVPANKIHPMLFGMPLSLVWQLFWISGAIAVLGAVFLWEKAQRAPGDNETATSSSEGASAPPEGSV